MPVVLVPVDDLRSQLRALRAPPGDPLPTRVVDRVLGVARAEGRPHRGADLEHVVRDGGQPARRVPLQAGEGLSLDEPVDDDRERRAEQHDGEHGDERNRAPDATAQGATARRLVGQRSHSGTVGRGR